jgi:hypothetical protein
MQNILKLVFMSLPVTQKKQYLFRRYSMFLVILLFKVNLRFINNSLVKAAKTDPYPVTQKIAVKDKVTESVLDQFLRAVIQGPEKLGYPLQDTIFKPLDKADILNNIVFHRPLPPYKEFATNNKFPAPKTGGSKFRIKKR